MNLLLVDDDRISNDILAEYIKPHLHYIDEVICAYDGVEAFDIVISVKPSIIVTDIKMPNVTGIDLIKKIRSIEKYNPYIIIVSGYSDFVYTRDAMQLNVTDYILKPVDQEELIDKINDCISKEDTQEKAEDEDIIETLKLYISDHLDESLTLVDIADKYHYNAAYLGRMLKKSTGCTFNEYLLKLRVIKAKSLLINTNDTIKSISSTIGFKDAEYFTKRFKKATKMTPSQYRDTHKAKPKT